jgi:hypothetical protein
MSYAATADGVENTFQSVSSNIQKYRSGKVDTLGFSDEQRSKSI